VGPGDLQEILKRAGAGASAAPVSPRLLVGTETGDDAAVYALTEDLALVMTTDFITPVCDDPFLYGQVAAANALSDVYAMGGRPLLALAVCAFPDALEPAIAAEICAGGAAKAAEGGAVVAGGHTVRNAELFYGLAVTGQVHPRDIIRNAGARPGDRLVLTKPLGTGILINGYRSGVVGEADLLAACRIMAELNLQPSALMAVHGAHAATDVTGFGLAGHALGMARASGVRLRVWPDRLPTFAEVPRLIEAGVTSKGARLNRQTYEPELGAPPAGFGARELVVFDPQTAGGLLVALPADRADAFVDALENAGTPAAAIIGEVIGAAGGSPGPGGKLLELAPST
jgi:selenide,water dikinase